MVRPSTVGLGISCLAAGLGFIVCCPNGTNCTGPDCCSIAMSDMLAVQRGLESFAADHAGKFPVHLSELFDRDDRPGYVKARWPIADPWNRSYVYECGADGRGWRLACYGADGRIGGDGDARDIFMESE